MLLFSFHVTSSCVCVMEEGEMRDGENMGYCLTLGTDRTSS